MPLVSEYDNHLDRYCEPLILHLTTCTPGATTPWEIYGANQKSRRFDQSAKLVISDNSTNNYDQVQYLDAAATNKPLRLYRALLLP
jgi:hypothetical protein